jgi:hypothetical protein
MSLAQYDILKAKANAYDKLKDASNRAKLDALKKAKAAIDDEEDDITTVVPIIVCGKKYLKDDENILYDSETHEEIGSLKEISDRKKVHVRGQYYWQDAKKMLYDITTHELRGSA